jgi:ferrous iron transport protein B
VSLPAKKTIMIVGNPNVGKSVLFNALSKQYVTVSNYPGTTVEVSRGAVRIGELEYDIVDTPGMYSLFPVTEEEKVARRMLMEERPHLVIHVVEARNLERMLPLTFQLLEGGLPVLLVLNMMDEAAKEGVSIDMARLEQALNIPVVAAVATKGRGIPEIREAIANCRGVAEPRSRITVLADGIENAVNEIAPLLPGQLAGHVSRRMIALLLFGGDPDIERQVGEMSDQDRRLAIGDVVAKTRARFSDPIAYHIVVRQREESRRLAEQTTMTSAGKPAFKEWLSRIMMQPATGLPILLAVLYLGLYQFVGGFGAGTAVDFLEGTLFEGYLNPLFIRLFTAVVPWPVLRDLVVGEYGVLTLGVRYAVAIILPIVTFFFIVFSIIEDSGYLPRLAMLIDRVFKKIGLSGRAVIPMVLGLGCATMATMVTRTLPTRRERVIATLLLALAVPCSAQLGVILALIQGRPRVVVVWASVVAAVFLAVGWLTTRVLAGAPPFFYMELPPLRLPSLGNVLTKTYVRVKWYLKEILPLFLLASVLIWLGQITRLFDLVVRLLQTPVKLVGLPPECAKIFLFGFFRRDYGAAGLYDLNKQNLLGNNQIAVAVVALTLFLPCVAQFLINIKERGWKTGMAISGTTLIVSFAAAYALNLVLSGLGVVL